MFTHIWNIGGDSFSLILTRRKVVENSPRTSALAMKYHNHCGGCPAMICLSSNHTPTYGHDGYHSSVSRNSVSDFLIAQLRVQSSYEYCHK